MTAGAVAETSSPDVPPTVGVVIATHNRPELLRKALASVLTQEYPGEIRIVVVFDRSDPDHGLEQSSSHREVRVVSNSRTPGLAGARNTGVLLLDTELVGFCDDDDHWLPGKLVAQVRRLTRTPLAEFSTTAMRVDVDGQQVVRRARRQAISIDDLVRSRMAMLHSSSFLFVRDAMIHGFGLVDEDIPRSMGEDWDLLLRAARRRPIEHLDEPLVAVLWGGASFFNNAWRDKNEAHEWLLDHHPEIRLDPIGSGLMYAKLAFGHAVVKDRRRAARYVARAVRARWREPRTPLAILVLLGVPGGWIQSKLNQRGYGI